MKATALDYAYARQSLAATVARSWYLTLEMSQLLALAEQSVTLYSELLKLIRIRRASGRDTDLDVVDMQANVDAALASVEAARESYGDIRRARLPPQHQVWRGVALTPALPQGEGVCTLRLAGEGPGMRAYGMSSALCPL